MTTKFTLLIILSLALFSCEKKKEEPIKKGVSTFCENNFEITTHSPGLICSSELCTEYQAIWKELFIESNNLSESFFDSSIIISQSGIHSWNDGISFTICYDVRIDWAIAYNCDQFIINIKKGNTLYPSLKLPRDTYLTKDQIRLVVSKKAFASTILRLSNDSTLLIKSLNSAVQNLVDSANVSTICPNRIFFNYLNGHISLEARAQYSDKINSCIDGRIDLINGKTEKYDGPCMID